MSDDAPDTEPHALLHDDTTDEATSPGGHTIPTPPPDGRIDAAPWWILDITRRLDALHQDVRLVAGALRVVGTRVTEVEQRIAALEDEQAEDSYGTGAA